jgi:hypothetical protein
MSAVDIIKSIKYVGCYPNVSIVSIVLLIMHATGVSAENSFSKLKLIETYLRSSMLQERLNGLATLSFEKDMPENIDVDVIINNFQV